MGSLTEEIGWKLDIVYLWNSTRQSNRETKTVADQRKKLWSTSFTTVGGGLLSLGLIVLYQGETQQFGQVLFSSTYGVSNSSYHN